MMNQKIFSSFLKMSLILGIMGIAFICAPAWAQSAFQNAYNALYETFKEARQVVYLISGFGLICFSIAAIMGKFDFVWLSMIALAIFILSAAELVVKTAIEYGGGTPSNVIQNTMTESLSSDVESILGYDDAEAQRALEFLKDDSF